MSSVHEKQATTRISSRGSPVVDGGLMAAGSNAMRALGGSEAAMSLVGVDRGSTGLESTMKSVE